MTPKTKLRALAATVAAFAAVAALGVLASAAVGHGEDPLVARVQHATARYHAVPVAERAGYHLLRDAAGIACIANPGVGAMGDHYVNQALVADAAISPTRPEAMVYAPRADGSLRLAAVEYIVLRSAWDAGHRMAPMLFGRMFMLTPAPNRFGLPAFYSLHAWIWKHNPRGAFAMWNPRVTCPAG